MKKVIALMLFAFAFAVSGCATTSGNSGLKSGAVDKIIEGKTTIAQVQELLGEPASAITDDKGGKIWSYYFSESTILPIPGINKTDTKTLNIRFNRNGIVVAKDSGGSGGRF